MMMRQAEDEHVPGVLSACGWCVHGRTWVAEHVKLTS